MLIILKKILLIILVINLLLIAPVNAKIVTAKVDDKSVLVDAHFGVTGTLHTEFGSIIVSDENYNKIMINDTIRFNTNIPDFWRAPYWEVEVIK